jgi:hypothetical protein
VGSGRVVCVAAISLLLFSCGMVGALSVSNPERARFA